MRPASRRRTPDFYRFRSRVPAWWAAALVSIGLLTAGAPKAGPQTAGFSEEKVQERVQALLSQMTLEEKIGQLNLLFYGVVPFAPKPDDLVRSGDVGCLLFVQDPATVNRLQKIAVEESRLHVPLLFGFDVIHGFRTIFPVPIALAASWDAALAERVQEVAALEASAAGVRWTFAPMVDIARDPRWGRIVEGAGEDPYLGSAMAAAQVRGFQGPAPGAADRLLACVKHFAGYGAAEGGRDYDSAYLPEVLLRNVHLLPFRAAVEAGAASLMTAYMDLNDVPATANGFLLQDILRRDWGFRGFVVSDAFSVQGLLPHGFARDEADAALRALTAGVDLDMGSGLYRRHFPALVQDGRLAESAIEAAAARVLAAKVRLGLFENPYVDEKRAAEIAADPARRQLARLAAQRSAVLLRNEGGLLPLDRQKLASIAVIGPLADSKRDLMGSWSLAGDVEKVVTIVEGIRAKVGPGVRVESAPGVQISRRFPSFFDMLLGIRRPDPWTEDQARQEFERAVKLAGEADAVILVLGELESMSGEAASRASLDLPGRQEELLAAVISEAKPVVLLLVNGRPLNLSGPAGQTRAILEVWHPGSEGGNAVADLLFGDANPGGKLPFTWPRALGQAPLYYNHNLTHQPENAPGFTSRYWDLETSPLYPFGFGLSYAEFAFSNLRLERAEAKLGETVRVWVDVENKGARAGDEVVQLYIHQRAGGASRPARELKGFQRVSLAAGEKKTVEFSLGKAELSYWSPVARDWVQEAETFDVWAGGNSTAELSAVLRVRP